jgi:hypothetical protein
MVVAEQERKSMKTARYVKAALAVFLWIVVLLII